MTYSTFQSNSKKTLTPIINWASPLEKWEDTTATISLQKSPNFQKQYYVISTPNRFTKPLLSKMIDPQLSLSVRLIQGTHKIMFQRCSPCLRVFNDKKRAYNGGLLHAVSLRISCSFSFQMIRAHSDLFLRTGFSCVWHDKGKIVLERL